jgi:oligopeptide transport system substrate-binding protein
VQRRMKVAVRPLSYSALSGLLLFGCSHTPQDTASHKAQLVRLLDSDAKGLDPQAYSDLASIRIAGDLFEGLTRFGAMGEAEPGLAKHWAVSADGLTWLFFLNSGLHFSDGHPISPQLFEAQFLRLNDPKTASPHIGLFEAIESVHAKGNAAVEVKLRHPLPALPALLAHPAMAALPLHRQGWVMERPLRTSGPYQLTDWALNDHLSLTINPAWHDGRPPVPLVEWRPVADSLVALRQFESGLADTVGEVPSTRLKTIRASMPGRLHVAPYAGSYYFAFNTRRPPFDDVRVRTALSLTVEREWLSRTLLATGVAPAWGVVPPGLAAYRPNWAGWTRARRLSEARRLLQAAGYNPKHPLSFEVRFNSDTDHRRIAVALAAGWKPLGVEARLLNSEASLHFASLKRADFELARSGWIGDIPVPENYLAVHDSKSGPTNYSGFHDRNFEDLLAHALTVPSAAARAAAMREAEQRLMQETPILPLYYYVSKSLVSARVSGWHDNLANIHPSRTLALR